MAFESNSVAFPSQPGVPPPLWSAPVLPTMKLRAVGGMLRRRGRLILLVTAVLTAVAVVAVGRITPRYTAQADVMISPRQQQVVDLKAVLAGLSGESEVVESEIQVLRSRELARGVVQRLDLDKNPEFNTALAAPGLGAKIRAFVGAQARMLDHLLPRSLQGRLQHEAAVPDQVAEVAADPLSVPVDAFLRRLGVAPKGRSRVISLTFDSADPVLAARAANAAVEAYIASQVMAKRNATIGAHRWLNERVAELREQVLSDGAAVEAFRKRAGLTQGRSGTLMAEQVTETGEQVIRAKAAVAEAEARLNAASSGGRLRAQGLEQAVQVARERLRSLQDLFTQLRDQAYQGGDSNVELRALQHEADADRALYDRLLTRLKETSIESGLQLPDAQVISRAEPPVEPAFPKLAVIIPISIVASCIFAALLAVLLESLDRGFSTPDQVELALGIPAISVMPALRRRFRRNPDPETYVTQHPQSSFGETIRALNTTLALSSLDRAPKVVMVASALSGEGKSSIVLSWARMMAGDGKRVVMVDCDLRRGRLHRGCGLTRGPGVSDFLTGTATLADIVHRDSLSAACVISTGTATAMAPDLIGSEGMRKMLAALSECFDLIVLDTAPLLFASETRSLCRLADKTVLVVRWQGTTRLDVAAGLRLLLAAGASMAGCVLSMVDVDRFAKYGSQSVYGRQAGLYLSR